MTDNKCVDNLIDEASFFYPIYTERVLLPLWKPQHEYFNWHQFKIYSSGELKMGYMTTPAKMAKPATRCIYFIPRNGGSSEGPINSGSCMGACTRNITGVDFIFDYSVFMNGGLLHFSYLTTPGVKYQVRCKGGKHNIEGTGQWEQIVLKLNQEDMPGIALHTHHNIFCCEYLADPASLAKNEVFPIYITDIFMMGK